jgi:glycosyltransferase involved in cell wall biosynthesis
LALDLSQPVFFLLFKKIIMITNKKIALFLSSLRGGGAERVFLNLANEFTNRGFKVDLVLAQKEGPYLDRVSKGIRVVDLEAKRVLFSLLPLLRYLKKENPDILISSMEHVNITSVLAKLLSHSKTKIIARVANTLSFSLKGTKWYKRGVRKYGAMLFYRLADEVVTNSKGSADDLSKTLKIPRSKIKVIYNPTVTTDILEKANEKTNHKWLKNKTCPAILGVGRLFDKQKDFSALIRAFAKLRRTRDAKLIILGEGGDREKLEELVKVLNLKDDVDMPGFVNNPYAYMAKTDVYVLSSRWEGLPNTLIEAMACGTPVVSTNCPSGPAEILEDGKYGKLVPVEGVDALAEAIQAILDSSLNSNILRKRASFFSVESAAKKYLELL